MGSITVGGITFSWTGTFTTGLFVDGLPWLYLPSGTVSMNEPTPVQTTHQGYQVHGAELNPIWNNEQGFSDTHATFNGARTHTTWPVTMSAGDILLKSVSRTDWTTVDNTLRRTGMYTEFCPIYIVDAIPGAEEWAPSAVGWSGRGTPQSYSIDTGQWADIDAAVAALPSLPTSGFPAEVPTVSEGFDPMDKFSLGLGISKGTNSGGGYQALTVKDFTRSGWNNYGEFQAAQFGSAGLLLVSDAPSTADKRRMLIRLISHGIQMFDPNRGALSYIGGNGAHHQYHQIPVGIYLKYTGQNEDDLTTFMPGNVLGQIFVPTQADIDPGGQLQPHTDDTKPACSRRRAITSVSGNTLTFASTGSDGAVVWMDGTVIRRVSDGATAYIQSASTNLQGVIDAQPSPAFTTSDEITIEPYGGWVVGYTGVQWLISTADEIRNVTTLVLGKSANYRSIVTWSGILFTLKALNIQPKDMDAVDHYMYQCNDLTDYPPGNDYNNTWFRIGGLDWAEEMWKAHYSSLSWSAPALQALPSGSVSATVTVP